MIMANYMTVNVRDFGALGDGSSNDTVAFQRVLDLAKTNNGVIIDVPVGVYIIESTLFISSNTVIRGARGSIIKRGSGCGGLFYNSKPDDGSKIYNGNGNITFVDIEIEMNAHVTNRVGTSFAFAHAKKVLFDNVEVRNIKNSHAMDLSGCRDVLINNCRFKGYTHDGTRAYSEAIQIDQAVQDGYPHVTNPEFFDGTACRNIHVDKCYFGPSEELECWNRAVGTHNLYMGGTSPILRTEDVFVTNNVIEGTPSHPTEVCAIYFLNYSNVVIENNILRNVHSAILVGMDLTPKNMSGGAVAVAANQKWSNAIIRNNQIFNAVINHPISVLGVSVAKCDDVTISGNLVEGGTIGLTGINVEYIKNANISENVVKNIGKLASLLNSENITVTGNVGVDLLKEGIYASDSSKFNISDNTFSEIDEEAIQITASDSFVVASNSINNVCKKVTSRAIHAYSSCIGGLITSNFIKTDTTLIQGIEVTNTCKDIATTNNLVLSNVTGKKVNNVSVNAINGSIPY